MQQQLPECANPFSNSEKGNIQGKSMEHLLQPGETSVHLKLVGKMTYE
jgi:hypothetical protein